MSPAAPDAAAPPSPEQPGATTFASVATWRTLTHALAVGGPRHLLASRRYRAAAHAALARLPVLG